MSVKANDWGIREGMSSEDVHRTLLKNGFETYELKGAAAASWAGSVQTRQVTKLPVGDIPRPEST